MKIELHTAQGSNSGERIEWLLNYKGVNYQRYEVLSHQLTQDYLNINPLGLVPAVRFDDLLLSESMAIAEYVEEYFPTPSLLGENARQRAQVRRVCEFVNSSIHAPQSRTVLRYFRPELSDVQKKQLRGEWIVQGLQRLQPMLCHESQFAVGTHFSLADIFVASIYKKAIAHGAAAVPFYQQHMQHLNAIAKVGSSQP